MRAADASVALPSEPLCAMSPSSLVRDASQNMKVAAVVSFYMAAALVVSPLLLS